MDFWSVRTGDEIEELAEEFNNMTASLQNSYATLEQQVKQRTQEVSALYEVCTIVNQSLDLDRVLDAVIQKITQMFRFETTRIFLYDATMQSLKLRASFQTHPEPWAHISTVKRGESAVGRVANTGEPLIFEDIQTDPRYLEVSTSKAAYQAGMRFLFVFPIKTQSQVFGAIAYSGKERRWVNNDEIRLLTSISEHVGVAVEKVRLFDQLKERSEELLEATRAKSEFIAAMSHELRTPLNIIIGNADLTGEGFFGDLNAEQKDALRKISRHARVLLKMINDLLSLSRLEAKKMSLDLSTVEIAEIVAHARTHVEQINRDNRLEVLWDVDRNLPALITDPIKLEEILQNLIGNAFKFTPAGRIEIRVRKLCDPDRIQFTIADTGIGIEPENLGKIFNEFEQIKEAHTGGFNGVGLGLSIVKKYLELMQGDIRVESKPGEGSTFTFSLPRSLSLDP